MINVKIKRDEKKIEEDSKNVAKVVLIKKPNSVLFLKRTGYVKKHAGEWDLPGGHLKTNEDPIDGLIREVKEETNLKLNKKNIFFHEKTKKKDKKSFLFYYYSFLEETEAVKNKNIDIKTSDEHEKHKFIFEKDLSKTDKFQSVALDILKGLKDD